VIVVWGESLPHKKEGAWNKGCFRAADSARPAGHVSGAMQVDGGAGCPLWGHRVDRPTGRTSRAEETDGRRSLTIHLGGGGGGGGGFVFVGRHEPTCSGFC